MIEALVDYIRQKGYEVHVFPGVLTIQKQVMVYGRERLFSYGWAISREDLNQSYLPREWFFEQADRHLAEIEHVIHTEKRACVEEKK